jgi:predicted benzoate:H+ symporter BenE
MVDSVLLLTGSYLAAFGTVFGLEILAAVVGLALLTRISVSAFKAMETRKTHGVVQ